MKLFEPIGLSGDHVRKLLKLLQDKARSLVGQVMIYEVSVYVPVKCDSWELTWISWLASPKDGLPTIMCLCPRRENLNGRSWKNGRFGKKLNVLYVVHDLTIS